MIGCGNFTTIHEDVEIGDNVKIIGDYVEYVFYARNEGEYTAYLNNINYLGDKTCIASSGTTESLVQSACNSINVTVTIGSTTYHRVPNLEE